MRALVQNFPNQLKEAIAIGNQSSFNINENLDIQNILFCGMGGSGIGSVVAIKSFVDQLKVPAAVCNDYHIPEYVSEKTLVVICSYSGNTEETLMTLAQAEEKGAEIACITSGGKVKAIAEEKGYNHIVIPGGNPPRSCIGYSLVSQLFALCHYGLIDNSFLNQLDASIAALESQNAEIISYSEGVAKKLHGKLPVIYGAEKLEGVSIRFRQQINENSKMLCWHHRIPEMNHNELVGWVEKDENYAVVIFRDETDYYRVQERIEFSKSHIANLADSITEIYGKGESFLERSLYLIHVGDWISVILADIQKIDAVEIDILNKLKNQLAELN